MGPSSGFLVGCARFFIFANWRFTKSAILKQNGVEQEIGEGKWCRLESQIQKEKKKWCNVEDFRTESQKGRLNETYEIYHVSSPSSYCFGVLSFSRNVSGTWASICPFKDARDDRKSLSIVVRSRIRILFLMNSKLDFSPRFLPR